METLAEYCEPVVSGSSPTLDLYGYALPVILNDELNLILSFPPIIEFVVVIVCLIQEMAPTALSTQRPQDLGVVYALLNDMPLCTEKRAVL